MLVQKGVLYLSMIFMLFLWAFYSSRVYYSYLKNPTKRCSGFKYYLYAGMGVIFETFFFAILIWSKFPSIWSLICGPIAIFVGIKFLENRHLQRQSTKKNLCGREVWVVNNKNVANAYADFRTNKIFVTEALVELLEEDELCAIIEHEVGHLKNTKLAYISSYAQVIYLISVFTIIGFVIVLILTKPSLEILGLYLSLYAIIYLSTVIATLWNWLNEHEADLNSNRKECLSRALLKLEMYNTLKRIYEVNAKSLKLTLTKFTELKPKEIKYNDVVKALLSLILIDPLELFRESILGHMPPSHPPTLFRLFALQNYSKRNA